MSDDMSLPLLEVVQTLIDDHELLIQMGADMS